MHQVLVVDDDPVVCELLGTFLGRRADFELVSAHNGREALTILEERSEEISLILLDLLMPGMDGWETLRAIRHLGNTPVIMVTAISDAEDVIKAFTLGVDDYVTKPFNLSIVEARIEAVLRRSQRQAESPKLISLGVLAVDGRAKSVSLRGEPLHVSPKEYQLIELLAERAGETVSSQTIVDRLWPGSNWATAQDVKQLVYLLRQKLEENPSNPRLLRTVRGFGYMLAE